MKDSAQAQPNLSPSPSPKTASSDHFSSAQGTSLLLLHELYEAIEGRLDEATKSNLGSLVGFLTGSQKNYTPPSINGAASVYQATQTVKFLKFYLEFNHLSKRFHRIRETVEAHLVPDLMEEFKKSAQNINAEEFIKYCDQFQIDLVLTAHPTEIYERKILKKYIKLMSNLQQSADSKSSMFHKDLTKERQALLLSLWLSPNRRRERPSPKDEAKLAQMIYQYSLWEGLSQFKRLFYSFLREQSLPLQVDKNNFQFYSWMGADRDGNPYVTAKATTSVVQSFIKKSCYLYYRSFKRLKEDLSFDIPLKHGTYLPEDVIDDCNSKIQEVIRSGFDFEIITRNEKYIYERMQELYDRLVAYNAKFLADQRLLNIMDRLESFGLAGMKWDIRQESAYHDHICDEIFAEHLLKPYSSMSESERLSFIHASHKKFKVWMDNSESKNFSSAALDFILTLKMISRYGTKVFKYYIISMTRSASDMLLIQRLLQSLGSKTQVVPLFETLEDLENSPEIMRTYFSEIKNDVASDYKQLVMLGYSDSAKTGSRLSSVWNIYHAQRKLSLISKEHHIPLWFFHGRGGSIGRGGVPVPQAIKSYPAESIEDGFRVTVQGEVIFDRFGFPEVAVQSMMTYIVSLLNYRFAKRKSPELLSKVENLFAELSEVSKSKYRDLIEHEEFFTYFESVTPVNHMADLNIGSRPTKRSKSKKKSYRAIPWIFGWTQNRSLLPAWYGAGTAIDYAIQKWGLEEVKFLYQNFFLFQSAIDSIYNTTLKTNLKTFESYHKHLSQKSESSEEFFKKIMEEYQLLTLHLHKVIDTPSSVRSNFEEKLKGRLEVMDWLNDYQIEILRQEQRDELSSDLQELLILSIQGIASGMGNTG